jgi:predicted Zn-dependent protease
MLGAILSVALSGCSLFPLDNGPRRAPEVPLPPTVQRGAAPDATASREHRRLLAAFGGEYRAPTAQRLVDDIVQRLAAHTDRPTDRFRVTLLNSPVVNAFALPNGNIYLTRGLLTLANDTSELAAVIAHEMAHVTARHAAERAELVQRAVVINRVVDEVLRDPGLGRVARDQGQLAIAGFSRQQELEADTISVRTLARAGFDPYGAPRFLTSLGRSMAARQSALGLRMGREGVDISATHPATPERIQLATLAARQIGAPGIGESDRNRYLNAISGVTVGDDPAQGFVRGRQFVHPKLAVRFVAPEGFVLENTADAVLGLKSGGGEALRFDTVAVPEATSLGAYAAAGLIEGAPVSDIESITLGGLPAVTGIARGDGWTFRVLVARVGGQVYRLMLAARSFDAAVDRRFRETIESFRRLTPEEAQSVRPLRVAVVTAGPGDTLTELAGRMALPDAREEKFRTLNGLSVDERVVSGQRYKVVVD